MSFFDNLSNVRKPDVIMNDGPLPTGGPPSFPNAKINYNSDLLGGISPYEYGEPDHLSSQTSYTNVAHRIQKIVPCIQLPNANSEGTFPLSHGVDNGDIGFVLRLDRRSNVMKGGGTFERLQLTRAIDPFVNLPTINFILAGIQRHWAKPDSQNWQQLLVDLRFVEDVYNERAPFTVADAIRFVTQVGRPFGIPHTSEMQGGQHEGSSSAVTFPVNFVSTFLVDGRVDNLVNIFSGCNISSGDDLIMKLEKLPISVKDSSIKYHLNHWSKQTAIQQFRYEEGGVNEAWQLVPGVLSTYTPRHICEDYDYRENGYWHILRSQVMARNEAVDDWRYDASNKGVYHDDRVGLRGALLEGTFAPVWVEHIKWKPKRGEKRAAEVVDSKPAVSSSGGGGWWGGGGGSGGDGGGGSGDGGEWGSGGDGSGGGRNFGGGKLGDGNVDSDGNNHPARRMAPPPARAVPAPAAPRATSAPARRPVGGGAPAASDDTSRPGTATSVASSSDGIGDLFTSTDDGKTTVAAAFPSTLAKKQRRVGLAVNVNSESKLPVLVETVKAPDAAL